MSSLKLFWSSRSPFVRKVTIAIHELGIAAEVTLVRIVVGPECSPPDLMAHNPVGTIPTLVLADGTSWCDSRTICEILDATYEGCLFPPPGPSRWRSLRWQSMADGIMEMTVRWLVQTSLDPRRIDQRVVSSCIERIATALNTIEADDAFFSDEMFDIGRLSVVSACLYLDFRASVLEWRQGRPRLLAWINKHSSRKSIVLTEYEDRY